MISTGSSMSVSACLWRNNIWTTCTADNIPHWRERCLTLGAYMVPKHINKHLHLEMCRKRRTHLQGSKNEALDHEIFGTNDVEECAAAIIWLIAARCALYILSSVLSWNRL